jgi:hypothetical protein
LSINLLKVFLSRLYHSTVLRIFLVLAFLLLVSLWALAYKYTPYYLNKTIINTYHEQTGHELTIGSLSIDFLMADPMQFTLQLSHLNDAKKLWAADQIYISVNLKESIHQRSAIINEVLIHKLSFSAEQNEQGLWNFNDVLILMASHPQSTAKSKGSGVPLFIKKIDITQASVQSKLQVLGVLPLSITPLDMHVSNIDLRTQSSVSIAMSALINKEVSIVAKGVFSLKNQNADIDVAIKQVPFTWFNPLVKPYAAVEILKGTINADNHLSVSAGQLVKLASTGELLNLKVRPTTVEQDAIKWKSLQWSQAEISLVEKNIHIPELTLNELDSQFIVGKDRKTNFQAMLIPPVSASLSTTLVAAEPLRSQAPSKWIFGVDRLLINNAALGFYDESLTPRFMSIIQKFTGDVTDISNAPEKTAHINLQGNVDGYAPVSVTGDARLFIENPQLNTLISFHKMDMGAFSPYSAEYAGWRIKKGLLSVDLNYRYQNGKVVGKNHVVMDHLEFGEKVRGAHIIDLPLRLGLSLLTDEHGIAVLDTEVSGDPSDPTFNFKDIITRAIHNSVKKLLTSPFRLIASLLNTKKDLGAVQFTAGEYQLTEETIAKLKLLQQALQKRPNMRLTLQGLYSESADTRALQEEQVTSAMQQQGIILDSIKSRNEQWAKAVDLRYQAGGLLNSTALAEMKYQELIAQEHVTLERLHSLSYERAQSVKRYLVVELAVPSELLLLNSDTTCSAKQCNANEVVFTLEE